MSVLHYARFLCGSGGGGCVYSREMLWVTVMVFLQYSNWAAAVVRSMLREAIPGLVSSLLVCLKYGLKLYLFLWTWIVIRCASFVIVEYY